MSVRDLKIPGQRHPEKVRRPDSDQPKKPDWIRVKAPAGQGYAKTRNIHARARSRNGLRGSGAAPTWANAGVKATPR